MVVRLLPFNTYLITGQALRLFVTLVTPTGARGRDVTLQLRGSGQCYSKNKPRAAAVRRINMLVGPKRHFCSGSRKPLTNLRSASIRV